MNHQVKTTSVILAIVMQLAPLVRQVITQIADNAPTMGVVFRWGLGTAALLGGVDAVSGASTVVTSAKTATGTNGVAFSYRITTGPQVASSFSATPLPPGLTVNTTSGKITGTPTQTGVTLVSIKGCDGGNGCTPVVTLTITIVDGGTTVTAPSITTQPASQTVTAGQGATFNVVAGGTAPLTYHWKFNSANIAGATSSSYTLANAQAANAGGYSVLVSNAAGTITSAAATLTVNPAPVAPSITTQPASQSVTAGANVSFTVIAAGTAPLTYQWRLNNANLAGATSSTYSMTSVQAANAGNYSVIVSNIAGTVTSATATLTVNAVPVAPSITTQPSSKTITAGTSASFSVTATGTGPLSYQWRFNSAAIAGATSTSYALANAQAANAGTYDVIVSNALGTVTSSVATLTVNPAPVAPSITSPPSSQTVPTGGSVTFSVTATGTGPLTYQWQFNGGNIAGATSDTYSFSNAQASKVGDYAVVVSNAGGSVTSASASLTVLPPPPTAPAIITSPASQTVVVGAGVSFTVAATGTGPLSYQWRFNGADIPGSTGVTLALSNTQTTDAGTYSVVVSNAAGTATSADATLTVQDAPVNLAGNYQGLFYDTNVVEAASSGAFTLHSQADGTCAITLVAGKERMKAIGRLDAAGHVVLSNVGSRALLVELQLDVTTGTDHVTGRVTDGAWVAALLGDRVVFDGKKRQSPFRGHYHVSIRGARDNATTSDNDDDNDEHQSNAVGTAQVNSKGTVRFQSALNDGLVLKERVAHSKTGELPFYVALPGDNGIVIGWMNLTKSPNAQIGGSLLWVEPSTTTELTVTGRP